MPPTTSVYRIVPQVERTKLSRTYRTPCICAYVYIAYKVCVRTHAHLYTVLYFIQRYIANISIIILTKSIFYYYLARIIPSYIFPTPTERMIIKTFRSEYLFLQTVETQ